MTSGYGIVEQQLDKMRASQDSDNKHTEITEGIVVNTNDPDQMGRVVALCTSLGDSESATATGAPLPWAQFLSPFGGVIHNVNRGPEDGDTADVAYGMWAIPKIGAKVLVMCINGDPNKRVWVGCLFEQNTPHTMPHGRHIVGSDTGTDENKPEGPLGADELSIEPLYSNYKEAFGMETNNKEWRTRGADYSVASVDRDAIANAFSSFPDDQDVDLDGTNVRQGYAVNRIDPNAEDELTGKVYDSQVYSITTPGFHAFSMDDRLENGRVRLRTTTGHQIILDDTNERIYISTAQGKSWVELDKTGNIDIFAEKKLSVRAKGDINFATDKKFRVNAKEGIHLESDDEIRIHSKDGSTNEPVGAGNGIHIKSDTKMHIEVTNATPANGNFYTKVSGSIYTEATEHINQKAAKSIFYDATENVNIYAGGNLLSTATEVHLSSSGSMFHTSGSVMNILASGNILNTGAQVHLNGPGAASATASGSANVSETAYESFAVNRKPDHEPYARVVMKAVEDKDTGNVYTPEFTYDEEGVNSIEDGVSLERGTYWRR